MSESSLTIDKVVKAWCFKSIDHFQFAFDVEASDWAYYQSYFDYLGFEVLSKTVVVFTEWKYFDKSSDQELRKSINLFLQNKIGHKVKGLIDYLKNTIGKEMIEEGLTREHSQISGKDLVDKVLPNIISECRYLIPNGAYEHFPIEDGSWHDPIGSSDIREFSYYFAKIIIDFLCKQKDLGLTIEILKSYALKKKNGQGFAQIFFK